MEVSFLKGFFLVDIGGKYFDVLVVDILDFFCKYVAPAAARRLGGLKLEEVLNDLGVLRRGRRGDGRQCALHDVIAMRGGRGEVVEMSVEVFGEGGTGGDGVLY